MNNPFKKTYKSKGLGDTIEKITKAVGIKPCKPCAARKKALNKLVPYKK
tara:strand:+ start:131 stop:277 length:147 start_codon:yes stop_codon:yes gene_type:complete